MSAPEARDLRVERERPGGPASRAFHLTGRFLLRLPALLCVVLVLAWGSLIWALSARTFAKPAHPSFFFELLSNLAHAPLFGVLALFLAALFLRPSVERGWPRFDVTRAGAVVLLTVLYGALDEWHQSRTPGRDSSTLDLVTDLVGACAVLWIVFYLGSERASEQGLWGRLFLWTLACVAAAALATFD